MSIPEGFTIGPEAWKLLREGAARQLYLAARAVLTGAEGGITVTVQAVGADDGLHQGVAYDVLLLEIGEANAGDSL